MKSTMNKEGGSQNNRTEDAFKMNARSAPGVAEMTNISAIHICC